MTGTYGEIIKIERKNLNITQLDLSKRIGMNVSRLREIEKGKRITSDVARFILEKMGSSVSVKSDKPFLNDMDTYFMVSVIRLFSKNTNLSLKRAYRYLKTFGGISFLTRYMDIERTLSQDDVVRDLTRICRNNGGRI